MRIICWRRRADTLDDDFLLPRLCDCEFHTRSPGYMYMLCEIVIAFMVCAAALRNDLCDERFAVVCEFITWEHVSASMLHFGYRDIYFPRSGLYRSWLYSYIYCICPKINNCTSKSWQVNHQTFLTRLLAVGTSYQIGMWLGDMEKAYGSAAAAISAKWAYTSPIDATYISGHFAIVFHICNPSQHSMGMR